MMRWERGGDGVGDMRGRMRGKREREVLNGKRKDGESESEKRGYRKETVKYAARWKFRGEENF